MRVLQLLSHKVTHMPRAALIYNDALSRHVLRDNHPMVPTRLRYTHELIDAYGVLAAPSARLVDPRRATEDELRLFHTAEYIGAVGALSRGEQLEQAEKFNFSARGDNPIYPGMHDAALLSTGASLTAVDLLMEGACDVACNFSGGLHHAMPAYASGFCIFNDPVIAIKAITRRGLKVAYVDIDCHHGDGVQYAFYDSAQVLTISIHESGRYLFPGTGFPEEIGTGRGRGFSVNVPLFPYTQDALYLWAFREVVPPLIRAFKPDVLVTQLGIDTHFNDPLTHIQLSVQGFAQVVEELAALSPGKWLALGGGGYDISAVTRGWTLAFSRMTGASLPEQIPQTFQEKYGLKLLLDVPLADLDLQRRAQARRYAEDSVAAARRLLFPFHGLSANA
ncbi:MAG: acetoin utilization protein AcuC [SAR202 cluster bacterium]|nr:acetoin utilization protein AcuC [SAR202 cluster bacterium]